MTPHRDPETGQFVAGQRPDTKYRDFHRQFWFGRFLYDSNDRITGNAVEAGFTGIGAEEVLEGDLTPDQVGEVVYSRIYAKILVENADGETNSDTGSVRTVNEFSRDSEPDAIATTTSLDTTENGDAFPINQGANYDDDVQLGERYEHGVSMDCLHGWSLGNHAPGFDAASSAGAGGDNDEFYEARHWRQEFGRGPIVWHNDELQFHFWFNVDDLDSPDIELLYDAEVVWDIHPRDGLEL